MTTTVLLVLGAVLIILGLIGIKKFAKGGPIGTSIATLIVGILMVLAGFANLFQLINLSG